MIESSKLDWIVQKTVELLVDKVKDAPLTDRDIDLEFEIFARPRLEHLSSYFESGPERKQARDFIMMKLQEKGPSEKKRRANEVVEIRKLVRKVMEGPKSLPLLFMV